MQCMTKRDGVCVPVACERKKEREGEKLNAETSKNEESKGERKRAPSSNERSRDPPYIHKYFCSNSRSIRERESVRMCVCESKKRNED